MSSQPPTSVASNPPAKGPLLSQRPDVSTSRFYQSQTMWTSCSSATGTSGGGTTLTRVREEIPSISHCHGLLWTALDPAWSVLCTTRLLLVEAEDDINEVIQKLWPTVKGKGRTHYWIVSAHVSAHTRNQKEGETMEASILATVFLLFSSPPLQPS